MESVALQSSEDFHVEAQQLITPKQPKSAEKWYHDPNSRNIIIMCGLTGSFMLVELIFGILTNSLALVADAFHMFSDQLSLIIGFTAIRLSKKSRSNKYSYGWIRAEVIGGLINGIFLLSVSLYIFMEAIQRFLEPPEITEPKWIMIVGGLGLLINVIGLLLLRGGGHGGHSHGHSHGHGHSHEKKKKHQHNVEEDHHDEESAEHSHSHKQKPRSVNIEGVFLHVLGDALGSVGAMISGACIWWLPWKHKYVIDPITSVVIGLVILTTSIPLVKHCIRVLMQSVPEHIKLNKIEVELLKVKGILSIHDLHVWQLSDTKVVGTVHLTCPASSDFSDIASSVKKILHEHGVHSTTVQPEFVESESTELICSITCNKLGLECDSAQLCCTPVNKNSQK